MIQLPEVSDEFAMWLIGAMTEYAEVITQDGAAIVKAVAAGMSEEKLLAGTSEVTADMDMSNYDRHNFVNGSLAIIFRERIKKALEEQQ